MALNGTRIREIDLLDLLEGIDAGHIALPNFQRDFEWTDSEIRALIGTVLSGWPMGSLLVIAADRETEEFYQPRRFEFAPPLRKDEITLIVLDGQQRLTSLYQAFYGTGPSRFAVKMADDLPIDNIDAIDSAIRSFTARAWSSTYTEPQDQWRDRMVPASTLRSPSDFFEWRDLVSSTAPQRLTELYRQSFSGLHRYRIPAVDVGTDLPPAAVARIFERVNRGGRRLSTFDLMVAKSFRPTFNLRTAWDNVRHTHPDVYDFCKGDGMPILTLTALRAVGEVRSSAVLDLKGSAIRDGFDAAVEHYAAAVAFARTRLGMLRTEWQPYANILVVMAALDYDRPLDELRTLITQWYWSTVFSGRYAVGSNTVAVSDFKSLRDGVDPTSRSIVLDRTELLECSKQHNGALHRAILCWLGHALYEDRGETLLEEHITESSIFTKDVSSAAEPPIHLRSLGFALWHDAHQTEPYLPDRQYLPDWQDLKSFDHVAALRIEILERSLKALTGRLVRIVEAEEVQDVHVEGQSGTDD